MSSHSTPPAGLPGTSNRHDSTSRASSSSSREREGSNVPFLQADAMESPGSPSPQGSPGVLYQPSSPQPPPPRMPMPLGGMGNISGGASGSGSGLGLGSALGSATGSGIGLMHDYLTRSSRPSSNGSGHYDTPPPTNAQTPLNARLLSRSTSKRKRKRKHQTPFASNRHISPLLARASDKQFTFAEDPHLWGSNVSPEYIEDDDAIHDPLSKQHPIRNRGFGFSARGVSNMGCLIILVVGLIGLFVGYPVAWESTRRPVRNLAGQNVGGRNGTGQVPSLGNWGIIDSDTPLEAYSRRSWDDDSEMELVFSDEFNVDGRSFYPGDDPYWEAADLHYWGTVNLEWYDPEAVTTADGKLRITLSQKQTHGLNYEGGMLTSWNKFCFTGGYIEANVSLPGQNDVEGLWPAIWTLGNLGRAGYGASLEGLWPYTYDTCDVGTVANQTLNGLPQAATIDGDAAHDDVLSYLPGQRLSRCTCPGEDHPGPTHQDGTFVGRAAPEIDIFEAQVGGTPPRGQVSLSAQWAPFNYAYNWHNTSDNFNIEDPTISRFNTYLGGAFQQATSIVTDTDQNCYTSEGGCFSIYGFEYEPGFDNTYITWISDNKVSWTLRSGGVGPDPRVEIDARPIPQEPMYMILNLGMSESFGEVELTRLQFPVVMEVDYIRVYQKKGKTNVGCDPEDFPTASYIEQHMEAYTNSNLTTWVDDYGQTWPRNSFLGEC